jgi:hypothetical protein
MYSIMSASNYNHKLGGHIHLKQLKVVCEFPSGSSILIPSAAVMHSNTPIAKGETWYSMTQYYGYQSAKSLLAQVGGVAKKQLIDGDPEAQGAWVMGLFSKLDELEEAYHAVFGWDY